MSDSEGAKETEQLLSALQDATATGNALMREHAELFERVRARRAAAAEHAMLDDEAAGQTKSTHDGKRSGSASEDASGDDDGDEQRDGDDSNGEYNEALGKLESSAAELSRLQQTLERLQSLRRENATSASASKTAKATAHVAVPATTDTTETNEDAGNSAAPATTSNSKRAGSSDAAVNSGQSASPSRRSDSKSRRKGSSHNGSFIRHGGARSGGHGGNGNDDEEEAGSVEIYSSRSALDGDSSDGSVDEELFLIQQRAAARRFMDEHSGSRSHSHSHQTSRQRETSATTVTESKGNEHGRRDEQQQQQQQQHAEQQHAEQQQQQRDGTQRPTSASRRLPSRQQNRSGAGSRGTGTNTERSPAQDSPLSPSYSPTRAAAVPDEQFDFNNDSDYYAALARHAKKRLPEPSAKHATPQSQSQSQSPARDDAHRRAHAASAADTGSHGTARRSAPSSENAGRRQGSQAVAQSHTPASTSSRSAARSAAAALPSADNLEAGLRALQAKAPDDADYPEQLRAFCDLVYRQLADLDQMKAQIASVRSQVVEGDELEAHDELSVVDEVEEALEAEQSYDDDGYADEMDRHRVTFASMHAHDDDEEAEEDEEDDQRRALQQQRSAAAAAAAAASRNYQHLAQVPARRSFGNERLPALPHQHPAHRELPLPPTASSALSYRQLPRRSNSEHQAAAAAAALAAATRRQQAVADAYAAAANDVVDVQQPATGDAAWSYHDEEGDAYAYANDAAEAIRRISALSETEAAAAAHMAAHYERDAHASYMSANAAAAEARRQEIAASVAAVAAMEQRAADARARRDVRLAMQYARTLAPAPRLTFMHEFFSQLQRERMPLESEAADEFSVQSGGGDAFRYESEHWAAQAAALEEAHQLLEYLGAERSVRALPVLRAMAHYAYRDERAFDAVCDTMMRAARASPLGGAQRTSAPRRTAPADADDEEDGRAELTRARRQMHFSTMGNGSAAVADGAERRARAATRDARRNGGEEDATSDRDDDDGDEDGDEENNDDAEEEGNDSDTAPYYRNNAGQYDTTQRLDTALVSRQQQLFPQYDTTAKIRLREQHRQKYKQYDTMANIDEVLATRHRRDGDGGGDGDVDAARGANETRARDRSDAMHAAAAILRELVARGGMFDSDELLVLSSEVARPLLSNVYDAASRGAVVAEVRRVLLRYAGAPIMSAWRTVAHDLEVLLRVPFPPAAASSGAARTRRTAPNERELKRATMRRARPTQAERDALFQMAFTPPKQSRAPVARARMTQSASAARTSYGRGATRATLSASRARTVF